MEYMIKDKVLFSWYSNWKEKSFSLGCSFASERRYSLSEGVDYSILNTDQKYTPVIKREYYLLFYLGFWQMSIGFYN